MEQVSRKVSILWKYNPTAFDKLNKDVLGETFRKIGSAVGAVSKITTGENANMLRMLMPEILEADPNSRDVNWDAKVKHYWDSLSVEIPSGGKKLETGFEFNIDDYRREKYIGKLIEKHKFQTSQDLAEYVMGEKGGKPNVPEELRYMYGQPIDVFEYLLWRYVLNYRHVANNPIDVNKSPNIRFYIHSDEDRDKIKKDKMKVKAKALEAYMSFIGDAKRDDLDDVLSMFKPESIKDIVKNKDIEDKKSDLLDYATSNPTKFVTMVEDKNLKTKSTIQRMLAFGVLKQIKGSTVIVESADTSVTIGNNIDEAVNFIVNEKNKTKVNELIAKYKSIA